MSDAAIVDQLHQYFGAGDYDGVTPWHQFRMKEIAKVKRYREKRGVAAEDLLLAIQYARATRQHVAGHWALYDLVLPAIRWRRGEDKVAQTRDLEDLIAEAIAVEGAKENSPWLHRLIRAAGPAREEVYREWETIRRR